MPTLYPNTDNFDIPDDPANTPLGQAGTGNTRKHSETVRDLGAYAEAQRADVVAHKADINAHHAKSHAHNGADGSGTVAHSALTGIGIDDHHARDHTLTGSTHTASGLTAGHALRATGASAFAFGQVQHTDLGGVSADQHHAKLHAHDGADGSGTVAHSNLTGVSANQHHNQAHTDADHTDGPNLKASAPLGIGIIRNFVDPGVLNNVTNTLAANRGHFSRLIATGTITKLRIFVEVQSGNIALAIYAPSGTGLACVPGTRLGGTGSVACPAPGVADIALTAPVTVPAGAWVAFAVDNATAVFLQSLGVSRHAFFTGLGGYIDSAFPLTTDPAGALTGTYQPLQGIIGVP